MGIFTWDSNRAHLDVTRLIPTFWLFKLCLPLLVLHRHTHMSFPCRGGAIHHELSFSGASDLLYALV